MDNIKEKIKTLNDETISNMLNQRKNHTSSFKDLLIDEQKKRKKNNQIEFDFSEPKKTLKQMEQDQKDVLRNLGYIKSL
mgnify:FL=1